MKESYPLFKSNLNDLSAEGVHETLSSKNKKAIAIFQEECGILSKSPKRAGNRMRTLVRFLYFLEKDYDKITYSDYVGVSKAISDCELGTHARNFERDFIKRFLRENYNDWAVKFKQFKLLKSEKKSEEDKLSPNDLITDEDREKLIKSTPNMKWKSLISVIAESAARPEEILKSRWTDVDIPNKMIYVFSNKTKKKRPIPLEYSIHHLKRLKDEIDADDEQLIFYSTKIDKQLTNSGFNLILKELAKKAGITKKINAYLFRHTRLSFLITKLSPKVYEEIAGHSLQMGMNTYAHLTQDAIKQEMREKVFGIEELSEDEKAKLDNRINELEQTMDLKVRKAVDERLSKIQEEIYSYSEKMSNAIKVRMK